MDRPAPALVRAPAQWLVLYDADCGLCKWLLAAFLRWDRGSRLRPLALQQQEAAEVLPDLSPELRMQSWHLISPAGDRSSAGAALSSLLRLLPGGRVPAAILARFPVLTERSYGWVAEHRSQLSKLLPEASKRRAGERVRARERERAQLGEASTQP